MATYRVNVSWFFTVEADNKWEAQDYVAKISDPAYGMVSVLPEFSYEEPITSESIDQAGAGVDARL